MKKSTKIFFLILLILIIGIFIHPQKVIYEANVEGKVINGNNKPVINAIVYRIENCYACEKVLFRPIIILKSLKKTETQN